YPGGNRLIRRASRVDVCCTVASGGGPERWRTPLRRHKRGENQMSRINTNVNSLIAQRILSQQNSTLNKSLERLSTGFRINRGGDDPAGLIASEALRSEKEKITA